MNARSSSRPPWFEVVATALLLWIALASTGSSSPATAPSHAPAAGSPAGHRVADPEFWDGIVSRLERLTAQLAAPRSVPAVAGAPGETGGESLPNRESVVPGSAPPPPPEFASVLAELRAVLGAVARLGSRGASSLPSGVVVPQASWEQIDRAARLAADDHAGALDELMFASRAEVLAKFGRPTGIYARQGGGQTWQWEKDDLDLTLVVHEGYVIQVY